MADVDPQKRLKCPKKEILCHVTFQKGNFLMKISFLWGSIIAFLGNFLKRKFPKKEISFLGRCFPRSSFLFWKFLMAGISGPKIILGYNFLFWQF